MPTYEYKKINVSHETPPNIETAANRWAETGWRTVAVIPARGPGYADALLLERVKEDLNDWEKEDLVDVTLVRQGGHNHREGTVCSETCPMRDHS